MIGRTPKLKLSVMIFLQLSKAVVDGDYSIVNNNIMETFAINTFCTEGFFEKANSFSEFTIIPV